MPGEPLAIGLEDVQQAQRRIRAVVRHTPCLQARFLREPASRRGQLHLKLECLQVSGSFKARGASNKVRSLPPDELARGLVTASGGNHAAGVAYAGWLARTPVRVFLPGSTPQAKAERLQRWGAEVSRVDGVWDDAHRAALEFARGSGRSYVHPFADPRVMAGQGTIGLEVLEQCPDLDTLLVSIGGGGLIAGIATAVKALRPGLRVVGVEPQGAPTLRRSVAAGRVITLDSVDTAAGTLAPRATQPQNLAIVSALVADIVEVSDAEMLDAARWLWFEMGLSVELSAAAALAALRGGHYRPAAGETVCAVICGAGSDGIT